MIGRIIAGLSIGGLSVMVPAYQGESSPRHVRGAIVCCYQVSSITRLPLLGRSDRLFLALHHNRHPHCELDQFWNRGNRKYRVMEDSVSLLLPTSRC